MKEILDNFIKTLESRIIATMAIVAAVIYVSFIVSDFNSEYPLFSAVFVLFVFLMVISFIIYVINNWSWKSPEPRPLPVGIEPQVAVLIPTWKEPSSMVEKTIRSILNQTYPREKVTIIVTDDARNPLMQNMVNRLNYEYPSTRLIYNIPPAKDSPERKGEGKAGNLNSALALVASLEEIEYIETRDADDLVGSSLFLRHVLGQLEADENIAFAQTIKKVVHSPGDPFGNMEELFYQSLMPSKSAANAVFPCGSGVVWRKAVLLDIGGFPAWNLVEDFQSGAEAVRRGWKSLFIPICGAVGQISPEDIPNLYKQRGTWSIDSLRFLFWGEKKGLNLRQRLHFAESGIFYIISVLTYFYAFVPAIILIFKISPIKSNVFEYTLYHSAYFLSICLFTLSLVRRKSIRLPAIVRSFQISFFGLAPVYFKALLKTLFYGPDRKPKYNVTRKSHIHGLYIFYVLPQLFLILALIYSIYFHITTLRTIWSVDLSNILWALFFVYMHKQIVVNSWFKFNPFKSLIGLFKKPVAEPAYTPHPSPAIQNP